MGLVSFVKEAGEKLVNERVADLEQQTDELIGNTGLSNKKAEELITEKLANYHLEIKNFKINITNATAAISGTVANVATKEKVVLCIGNLAGIALVDDELEVKVKSEPSSFHNVKEGETLTTIATEFFGITNKAEAIFKANEPMLKHQNNIYPGQKIRIPVKE